MGNKQTIAVLLTCFNRKNKTLNCLMSFYGADLPAGYNFDIFLVDDGSTDGTSESVRSQFPKVNIIQGNGELFWAGGMRLAWNTALQFRTYDAFLLLNDDVTLTPNFFYQLIETDSYSITTTGKRGIYAASTNDETKQTTSYGGRRITRNGFLMRSKLLTPSEEPQHCDLVNANILWVSREVVDTIGIFDEFFIHGIADFAYSQSAKKSGFPVLLTGNIGGYCSNDHGNSWKPSKASLSERVEYLKSPLGLAYNEYLYYIKKYFPAYYPYSFVMLWLKTFFPVLWEKFK